MRFMIGLYLCALGLALYADQRRHGPRHGRRRWQRHVWNLTIALPVGSGKAPPKHAAPGPGPSDPGPAPAPEQEPRARRVPPSQ